MFRGSLNGDSINLDALLGRKGNCPNIQANWRDAEFAGSGRGKCSHVAADIEETLATQRSSRNAWS